MTDQAPRQSSSVAHLALPDYQAIPASVTSRLKKALITLPISRKFRRPKVWSGSWNASRWTPNMTVPKATMHQYSFAAPRKSNVRSTWYFS